MLDSKSKKIKLIFYVFFIFIFTYFFVDDFLDRNRESEQLEEFFVYVRNTEGCEIERHEGFESGGKIEKYYIEKLHLSNNFIFREKDEKIFGLFWAINNLSLDHLDLTLNQWKSISYMGEKNATLTLKLKACSITVEKMKIILNLNSLNSIEFHTVKLEKGALPLLNAMLEMKWIKIENTLITESDFFSLVSMKKLKGLSLNSSGISKKNAGKFIEINNKVIIEFEGEEVGSTQIPIDVP